MSGYRAGWSEALVDLAMPDGSGIFTFAERPDLESRVRSLPQTFPEFMYHDATVDRHWDCLFADFAGFQIAVCDRGDEVVAAGHCIPVFWDETRTARGNQGSTLSPGHH